MSNFTSTLPSILNTIQEKLTYIVLPIYVILGSLGNTFCIIYFSERSQRVSSCAFYLLLVAGQCVMTSVYSLIFTIYQMFIAGIFPPVIMIIFSSLAYLNMRMGGIQPRRKRQQQRQLVSMVITQIIIYIISAELNPITTLYKQLTANVTGKSLDRKSIESFITFIAGNVLLYLNTWAPFLIYYGTSSRFRTAFIHMFKKNYRIQPTTNTTHGINIP